MARAAAAAATQEVDQRVLEWKKANVLDEAALLKASDFPIAPDALIEKAQTFMAYNNGLDKPELFAEDFVFVAPVVGPIGKEAYVRALQGFDLASAFPDLNDRAHHFRVDPLEPSRVWWTVRGVGTNTGSSQSPALKTPTGKAYEAPPEAVSLRFSPDGKVSQMTVGYVMDKTLGNTGGLGGVFGILYAIGKPLPFREARPWKPSLKYRFFQKLGAFLEKLQK